MDEYVTIDQAVSYIGVSRASLYNYMTYLGITPRRFEPDKRRKYLARADVETLKAFKEKPWSVHPSSEVTIAEKRH